MARTVFDNWLAMLRAEYQFYCGDFLPLTEGEAREAFNRGAGVATAYGIACDVANGWTFAEAMAATYGEAA